MDKKVKYAAMVLCTALILLAAVIGYEYLSANYESEVPSGTETSEEKEGGMGRLHQRNVKTLQVYT